jgi:tape measure domain-containing protein
MADGVVDIDVLIGNKQQIESDVSHINALLSGIGHNAGDELEKAVADNVNKAKDNVDKFGDKVQETVDKKAEVKVDADTSQADEKLNQTESKKKKVSKPTTTKLKGDSKDLDEKARKVEDEKRKVKKPVSVRIIADLKEFSGRMKNAKEQLSDLKERGQRLKGVFAGSFLGTLAGNAVSSGLSLMANGIKAAGAAALNYDRELQTLQATWKTLTGSASEGQKMTDMTLKMAAAANNSVDMVQDLNAKMYSVTNSAGKTKELTTAMLTLQDAFGQTDDAVKGFATQWGQMQANGKVQAMDMMSFVNVFPKIRTELLDTERAQTGHHNMTMSQLNDMMSAGKISSATMDTVLLNMQKKYSNASVTFSQTFDGLVRTMKGAVPRLLGDITAPFLDKEVNPIMKGLAGWFSDSDTEKLFKQESVKLSKSMEYMTGSIKDAFNMHGYLDDYLDKGVEKFSDGMRATFNWVGDHAKDIKTSAGSIASIAKSLGSGVWKGAAGTIKAIAGGFNLLTGHKASDGDAMHSVADSLKSIASHKDAIETIGKMWGIYWVASKFFGIASGIGGIGKAIDSVYRSAKILGGLGDVEGKTTGIFSDLLSWAGKLKGGFKGGFLKNLFSKDVTATAAGEARTAGLSIGGKLVAGLGIALAGFDIAKGLMSKNRNEKYQSVGKGIGTLIGGGVGMMLGGPLGAMIGSLLGSSVGKAGGKAAKKMVDGWNDYTQGHKPKTIMGKVGFSIHEAEHNWNNAIASLEKKHPVLTIPLKVATSKLKASFDLMKLLGKNAEIGAKGIGDVIKDGVMGRFGKLKKDLTSDAKDAWKNLKSGFTDVWNDITGKNDTLKKESGSKKSSGSKSSTTTKEAIKSVATTHVSKTDISNVKKMVSAIKNYKGAIKSLNSTLKSNDPSEKLSKISHNIKSAAGGWSTISKPIKSVGSAFKTLASFSKSMNKNDAFDALNRDLPKLDKTLKNQKIGSRLKSLGSQIKDSKVKDQLHSLTNSVDKDTKKWKSFAKPVKTVGTAFNSLTKFLKQYSKGDPFKPLTSGIKGLAKEMDKDDLGKKFKSLTKQLKDNNPSKELKKMNGEVKTATKTWGGLAKPLKTLDSAFRTLDSFSKKISGKNDPILKLSNDFKDLQGTLKKTNIGKVLQDQMDDANDAMGKKNTGFVGTFSSMIKTIKNDLKSFKTSFEHDWKDLWSDAYNDLDRANSRMDKASKTHSSTMRDIQDSFEAAYLKSERSWLSSVTDEFSKAFNKLPDLAYKPLSKVIGYLNKGINGIDYVLGKFGGSTSTIKTIKFAAGTGLLSAGRLNRSTIAMLNDGNDSPQTGNVERVVRADGSTYEPVGRNVTTVLQPGDGVLNASENRMMKQMHYFASGTGILDSSLFKGITGSYQDLIDLAQKLTGNINKSFDSLFGNKPSIKGDVQNGFENVFDKQTKDQGHKWWSAVWSVINDAIGAGDGASGLLEAVERYGKGKPYVWGATGPDSFDCSGLVMYSLKKAFNILYPRVSGAQIARASRISKGDLKQGDLIGNSEHIGVYAGHGKYWSAMSPDSNPNIGMSYVSSFPGTPLYGRVQGIKDDTTKTKQQKSDKTLEAFVKQELGANMFAWIKKHLEPLTEVDESVSGSAAPTGSHKNWLKQAGIPESQYDLYNYIITRESGWNVHAQNPSSPAFGIPQSLPGSKMASAGSDWHDNPITQLKWMQSYVKERYGGVSNAVSYWKKHHNYANGGWGEPGALNIFNEVPGEPEVAINPARPSADRLIAEVITERAKKAPNGIMAKAAKVMGAVKQHAQTLHTGMSWSQPVQAAKAAVSNSGSGTSGSTTINFVADGQTLASVVYPKAKLMQQRDITIAAKKEGLH